VLSVYPSGITMHVPSGPSDHKRGKRTAVVGWSTSAVRRHTSWLKSIQSEKLDGHGYALTLTVRDLPEDAAAFHSAKKSWIERMRRHGFVRVHWIVEWQRRGVPHLHIAIYFPDALSIRERALIVLDWQEIAAPWGAQSTGQDLKPIEHHVGWLQYLSKHSARGVKHYQRYGKPATWETTGRLWGKGGDWPEADPMRFALDTQTWHRFRRLARAWRIADARSERNADTRRSRISSARRCLRCAERKLSSVRGVSEWLPDSVAFVLLAHLAAAGSQIHQND
jgi:hypothetical protein